MKRWTFTLLVLLWCIVAIIYATFFSPSCRADQQPCDCDGTGNVTITDVVALINYIFNDIEPPRNEWVEVDTSVSVVQILDRPFTIRDWPVTVQNHFYLTTRLQIDTTEFYGFGDQTVVMIDTTTIVDTTIIREYVFRDATYPSGNELIRSR